MPREAPVPALNTPVKLRTASRVLPHWKKVFQPLSLKAPAIQDRKEPQILLLNSDYSTKSKSLKIHRLPQHTNSKVPWSLKHKRPASKGK